MRTPLTVAVLATAFLATPDALRAQSPLDALSDLAAKSSCAAYEWKHDQGVLEEPKSYIRGMALVYAKAVCEMERSDVRVVSAARGAPGTAAEEYDALTWYESKFKDLDMPNDKTGIDTLRHTYTLLIGLGMLESSGRYCLGRDLSQDFNWADGAEAGPFQTSWGVHEKHAVLDELTARYTGYNENSRKAKCLLGTFRQKVHCSDVDRISWGDGRLKQDKPGMQWQRLTKTCPAFAAEYAAVVVRVSGGSKGEFGPLRSQNAEVRSECDDMLKEIQRRAQANPAICDAFK